MVSNCNSSQKNLLQLREEVAKRWDADMQEKLSQQKMALEKMLADKIRDNNVLREVNDTLVQEKERLEKQLSGALRVIKERANVNRGIRPKSRSGYVLLGTEELTERIVSYDANISETVPVYRTNFQTCYCADVEIEVAKDFVRRDLETTILAEVSLQESAFVDAEFLRKPEIVLSDVDQKNRIYRLQLKYSSSRRYYEVSVYHTTPIGMIDDDLLPSQTDYNDKKIPKESRNDPGR